MTIHETDVAIIGAGPVGLFAVFECGMVRVRCHVIDALGDIGGQCTALYPEKPIYDIPGFPAIDAAELIANLETQAAPFDPVYHLGQQVTGLEQTDCGFRLTTSAGTVISAKAVILAAGVGAFGPNRPPMDGIEAYEGGAVQYHVRRRADFAARRVVIAGGGDSAVDWAISLAEVAEKIYVVHRRDKFRAAPETVERMRALAEPGGKVELVIPYQLHGLEGDGTNLTGVTVRTLDGDERRLEADSLLPFFGLSTELGPIAGWGFEMERKLIATEPATSATSIPGIFAIGDIATYPGKLKLILCGFSEAAMAAHAIYPMVHPDEVLHFEYSTTKGVPGAA